MKLLQTVFALLFISSIQAQEQRVEVENLNNVDPSYSAKTDFSANLAELEGTFQIQYTNSSMRPLLYKETIASVKQLREESTDVYFNQSEFVKIYIPSLEKISSPDFIPLEREKYVENSAVSE
jgi:hypothetical protein